MKKVIVVGAKHTSEDVVAAIAKLVEKPIKTIQCFVCNQHSAPHCCTNKTSFEHCEKCCAFISNKQSGINVIPAGMGLLVSIKKQ